MAKISYKKKGIKPSKLLNGKCWSGDRSSMPDFVDEKQMSHQIRQQSVGEWKSILPISHKQGKTGNQVPPAQVN